MIIHGRTHSNNYIRFLRHHSPPFLLRDAMLVQYLLSSCVVTSPHCLETTGRIELGYDM